MVWTDDPKGFSENVAAVKPVNLGSPSNRLGTVYADVVDGSSIIGDPTLANNDFLEGTNAAGTSTVGLVKLDATDDTVINASTGNIIKFAVNDVAVGTADANSIDFPAFNLTDGSDKNYQVVAQGAGTAYSLTNTAAAIDLGTTDPAIVLNKAGTYLLLGRVNLKYNAATFAASRTVTLKLRRTNNTPADLTDGTSTLATNIITTLTYTMGVFMLPPIIYTTAVLTDAITIFADVSVVPSAGSLDAVAASIVAIRLS